jgi:hypothetical protein
MFARHVTMQVKPTMVNEFPVTFEKEILPLLRKQKGFLDEMLLARPEKREVIAISLWEEKKYAEIYKLQAYPEIVKILNQYIEGVPVVETYEVAYATLPTFAKFTEVVTL